MEVNDILVLLVNHNRKKEYLSDFTLQHYRKKKLLSIYKIHIPKTHQLSSGIVKLYYLNIIKVKKIYSKRK